MPSDSHESIEWLMIAGRKIHRELRQRATYTPDNNELCEYEYHLLFIDGILRPKFGKQGKFLNDSKYLGSAHTASDDFKMKRTNQFPITFMARKEFGTKKVIGDIYAVTTPTLRNLDMMYANGIMWNRRRVYVSCEDQLMPFKQGQKRVTINAWMYLGIEDAWKKTPLAYADPVMNHREIMWEFDPETPTEI